MRAKKGVVLLEMILAITLFSVLWIYSLNIILELHESSTQATNQTINNLKLESTRLFLMKNNQFQDLLYSEQKLLFQNKLLLDDVTKYTIELKANIVNINICVEDKVCQEWVIKR